MSDLFAEGVETGSSIAGGFIHEAINEGLSANQALQAFRDAGGAMGRSQWLDLYGQVRATVGNVEALQGIRYDTVPDASRLTEWQAGEAGRYATVVQTFVRPPGSTEWEPRFTTVVTDRPHTPQEAVDFAQDELNANSGPGGPYGDQVIGASVVSSMNITV